MRLSSFWAICLGVTAFFLAGCGGGGGNSGSTSAVKGVWTGTGIDTRAAGDTNTIQAEFVQNGTALTGTAIVTDTNAPYIATIAGTVKGNKLTATITNVQASVPRGPVTEQSVPDMRIFPLGGYPTLQPIDTTKPIVVSANGQVLPASSYTVSTDITQTLGKGLILISDPLVLQGAPVSITYYPLDTDPDTDRVGTYTGTIQGNTITGTYTTASTHGNTAGTFTFTKSVGVTTPNLPSRAPNGAWSGKYLFNTDLYVLSVNLTQTGNSLTFTGQAKRGGAAGANVLPYSVSGTGAVVGNNVTLLLANGYSWIYLSGTYAPTTAVGEAITGTAKLNTYNGTMDLEPDNITANSRKGK